MVRFSFNNFFLLLLVIPAEAEENEPSIKDMQIQINKLLEYRELDLHMIETLVAERAEDRRKLETVARDVEHFQSEIFMMKKLKKQDEQEIRHLSEILDVVLEDREKDREMIENLEMTMCKKYNDCDLNNHDGIRKMNDVYKIKFRDENYVMAQSKV